MKNNKYIIIQTLLIIFAILTMTVISPLLNELDGYNWNYINTRLAAYGFYIIFIFIPLLAVYFLRLGKNNYKTLNTIFKTLIIISILFISWAIFTYRDYFGIFYIDYNSVVSYLLVSGLFVGAYITNLKIKSVDSDNKETPKV